MSYPAFPASLGNPLIDGFAETAIDDIVTDESDIGAGTYRAASTKTLRRFNAAYMVTPTQKAALNDFHATTIGRVGFFNWTHPQTDEVILVRIPARPSFAAFGPYNYIAQLTLEEV
jgi:hypothetical protein